MREAKLTAALLGLCFLPGCGPQPVTATAHIELEQATAAELAQAARVLDARFESMRPSMFSSHTVTVTPVGVVVEFRGEAPSDAVIREYASTLGIYRLFPADRPAHLLMTDKDIVEVSVFQGTHGASIDLEVNEAAARRLLVYTTSNAGKLLVTTWDRKELTRATIQGVFSQRFQTTGMDLDTARKMAVLLRSGRLPAAVRNVEVRHPAQ